MVNHLIVPRNWIRFTFYAHRIRKWRFEDLTYIEEPIVDHIAFGRNPGYLFPRLTHMDVLGASVSGMHLQTLFLCSTIQAVAIRNNAPNAAASRAMNTFLRTLADRAPTLKSLIVDWGNGEHILKPFKDGLMDVYEAGVQHLQTLQLMSPSCVDTDAFILISKLQKLTTLYLNLESIGEETQLQRHMLTQSDAFPALQYVFLSGKLVDLTNTLRCFGNSSILLNLAMSVKEYPSAKGLRQLLQIVASRFTSLRMIQLMVARDEMTGGDMTNANQLYSQNPTEYLHRIDVIEPILALHTLASAIFEIGVPLLLSDADLHCIGEAWPDIEILVLGSDPFCFNTRHVPPSASVQGLLALVTQCPLLQRLGLFLDFSMHITEELVSSCALKSASVVHLDVGRSWILSPPIVAALLSGVFPNLAVFTWQGKEIPRSWVDGSHGYSAAWKQVLDILPVFRATRLNAQIRSL